MIEVKAISKKTKEETTVRARPMTEEEVQRMREAGHDIMMQDELTTKSSILMFDWIVANVYGEYDFKKISYPNKIKLARTTFRLTYGLEEDEKNS